jgi:hypothetical protein
MAGNLPAVRVAGNGDMQLPCIKNTPDVPADSRSQSKNVSTLS